MSDRLSQAVYDLLVLAHSRAAPDEAPDITFAWSRGLLARNRNTFRIYDTDLDAAIYRCIRLVCWQRANDAANYRYNDGEFERFFVMRGGGRYVTWVDAEPADWIAAATAIVQEWEDKT